MRSTRAFVAGLLCGVLVSGAVTAQVNVWFSGAELMAVDRGVRTGYAPGAADMMAPVADLQSNPEVPAGVNPRLVVANSATGLLDRSGGSLGQFTDWAETH
jgi:hypothetical protein